MTSYRDDILYHYGVPGMRWGVRRYQNKDGTLTPKGKQRYKDVDSKWDVYSKKNAFYDKANASLGRNNAITKRGKHVKDRFDAAQKEIQRLYAKDPELAKASGLKKVQRDLKRAEKKTKGIHTTHGKINLASWFVAGLPGLAVSSIVHKNSDASKRRYRYDTLNNFGGNKYSYYEGKAKAAEEAIADYKRRNKIKG